MKPCSEAAAWLGAKKKLATTRSAARSLLLLISTRTFAHKLSASWNFSFLRRTSLSANAAHIWSIDSGLPNSRNEAISCTAVCTAGVVYSKAQSETWQASNLPWAQTFWPHSLDKTLQNLSTFWKSVGNALGNEFVGQQRHHPKLPPDNSVGQAKFMAFLFTVEPGYLFCFRATNRQGMVSRKSFCQQAVFPAVFHQVFLQKWRALTHCSQTLGVL